MPLALPKFIQINFFKEIWLHNMFQLRFFKVEGSFFIEEAEKGLVTSQAV